MFALIIGGTATVVVIGALWLRRRWLVVAVQGPSMRPTLHDGDLVLVRRRGADGVERGDVVVLRPPSAQVSLGAGLWRAADDGLQVKRLVAVAGDVVPDGVRCDGLRLPAGTVAVLSDDLEVGSDSRRWGPYPAAGLVGVVVRRLGGGPRR
ncbi:S26 family signal peptidase [Micromonospora andamanensis]|uniref:Peptidase S26 domain-containing protein n=1 Tax=Micromonospora andamanensis TaxID=1287068 RepID=A0ABQ4I224_9ACTN|nr:S26 family signal peptidase [Micromonospora andamanensis]GIJ11932.1 hypothetical protein Van01_51460 [Micromonospora andamanensis]GIJ42171.1 hypothetical protein Vwe01_54960 [Micromonospora andamanensis]